MKIAPTAAALALLLGLTGASYQRNPAAPRTQGPAGPADKAAAQAAHMTPEQTAAKIHAIDQMEIEAGKLALRKSKDSEVIRYARLLVRDHQLADDKLARWAKREGLTLGVHKMDASDAAAMRRLEAASSGPDFDRAFTDAMKLGHDKALAFLGSARVSTTDFRLRGFLDKLIPVIEQHDKLAGKLQAKRLG